MWAYEFPIGGPSTPFGSVETTWRAWSSPRSGMESYTATVALSSLMTYNVRPLAASAKWRGPAPGFSDTTAVPCWLSASSPAAGVELVDQHLIDPEIGDQGKAAID